MDRAGCSLRCFIHPSRRLVEGMAGEWLVATQLAAAGLMLALAAWLCWLDFRSRAVRAFATFLVLWAGVTIALRAGAFEAVAPPQANALADTARHYRIGALGAMVYFAAVYPRPRGWLARPIGLLALVAVSAGVVLALLAQPCLASCREGSATLHGPLVVITNAVPLAAAALAVVFARDAARAPAGHARTSLLLVTAGFLAHAVVTVGLLGAAWILTPQTMIAGLSQGWGPVAAALNLAPIGPAAAALVLLRRATRDDPSLGGPSRRLVLLVLLGLLVGAVASWAPDLAANPNAVFFVLGLWRLAFPILIGYALVRHRLFDIDLSARRFVDRATLAAFFAAAYFIVSEAVASYLGPRIGTFAGIVAAGLLLFAAAPLERAAVRLARRAVGPALDASDPERRREIYREMARRAWANGALDARERRFLDGVRARLALTAEDTARIEADALDELTTRS